MKHIENAEEKIMALIELLNEKESKKYELRETVRDIQKKEKMLESKYTKKEIDDAIKCFIDQFDCARRYADTLIFSFKKVGIEIKNIGNDEKCVWTLV